MSTLAAGLDPVLLSHSYAYCERLTRHAARNFYYALKLLPQPKRSAMYALYAYMRLVDDIADDPGQQARQRADALDAWCVQTRAVLQGQCPAIASHPVWPAFADMVHRYRIPASVFDDMLAGQQQDLHPVAFETFEQLHQYCCRVAGTVGLASIFIWGFDGAPATQALAIDRGIAFQLTNILRDLREDLSRGRLYLPRQELAAMHLGEDHLRTARDNPAFRRFMGSQIERAQAYYTRSAELESHIDPDSRPALIAMTGIYHALLNKIAARPERVLRQRVSLSLFSKLLIAWRAIHTRSSRGA